jgi:anti-sigma factor (TIGR02949 family)
MRCKKVIAQLSAYLDGQLTAAEREAVRSHLTGCAQCRAELEALDRTAYAVADLQRLRAPADLRDKVLAKLDGVTPAEARHPRWRMYWGVAAAIAFAIVIMILTAPPAPHRAELAAAAPAEKNAPGMEVASANRGGAAGPKGEVDNLARSLTNAQPYGGPAYLAGPGAFQVAQKGAVSSEQIVLPSANPPASYSRAVAIAVNNKWLPPGRKKDQVAGEQVNSDVGQSVHQGQVLELTFRMKRDQVPVLKNALAVAGLMRPAGENGARDEESQQAQGGASRLAAARPGLDEADKTRPAAPMKALRDREGGVATANTVTVTAAAGPAPAAMKAPGSGGGAEPAGTGQFVAEKEAQGADAAAAPQERKAEAAEESLVLVTLLFPLAESPVPAAPPAAGAANSTTP